MSASEYRADIDGLRAVAVGLVLAFHLELLPLTGGFVGVDVFFVISGYVISRMIVTALAAGRFSLADFYVRRTLRIVPALLVVTAFTLACGWIWLGPEDYRGTAKAAFAANLFHSNFYFARFTDYFAPAAHTQPLLHTWSLGVEEQFYILAPLAIMRFHGTRLGRPLLAAMFVASLAFALRAARLEIAESFYLPHHRFFELLIGVALGTRAVSLPEGRIVASLASAAGLALVAASAIWFDKDTPFPGAWALVPSLGAALVIAAGEGAAQTSIVNRLAGQRAVVAVGKLSYSLYMWHWPLLVFARVAADRPLEMAERWGLLALTVAVSWFSYRLIERPIRGLGAPTVSWPARGAAGGAMALTLIAVATSVWIDRGRGIPERLSPEVVAMIAKTYAGDGSICPGNSSSPCRLGSPGREPDFLVLGDSHALVLSAEIARIARTRGIAGIMIADGGCPPLWNPQDQSLRRSTRCEGISSVASATLADTPSIRHVVIVARWAFYTEVATVAGVRQRVGRLGLTSSDEARRVVSDGLAHTVDRIRRSGRSVTIVGPVPELPIDLTATIVRAAMAGVGDKAVDYALPRRAFESRQQFVLPMLEALPGERGTCVAVVYPHRALCLDQGTCRAMHDGRPLYSDSDHLNTNGTALLRDVLSSALMPPQADCRAR